MSYLTSTQYENITGDSAPEDFASLVEMADTVIDAHTLYGLQGRELSALPQLVQQRVQEAVAYEVQYLVQSGGLPGVNEPGEASAALGKYSYSTAASRQHSGEAIPLCPASRAILPFLVGYLRGCV